MDLGVFDLALVFILVAFAGFVDSVAGGGGLITVPTYLFVGLPPQVLLGTNKLVSTIGATMAVFRYAQNKVIHWKLFFWPILVSAMAAFLGAYFSRYQSEALMLTLLLFVVPVVLGFSLKKPQARAIPLISSKRLILAVSGLAVLVGGYDGFFGPGTGSFFLFGLLYFLKLSPQSASVNARILNYASNLGALTYFATQLQFDLRVAGVGIVASVLGNYLGSHMVIQHADRVVRPLFLVVLVGLLITLAARWFVG